MKNIRYSFIIPVKDQINLTRDCLLSWFAYTSEFLPNSEVLIVDDGSNEQTQGFLSKLPAPIRVITHTENMGFACSNNRAASEAKGKYLILLNNDLILQRGWLDAMLSIAESSKEEQVVGNVQLSKITGRVDHVGKFFDENGDPRHFGQLHPGLFPWNPPVDYMECPSVTAACWLVHRSLFLRMGGFDEAYINGYEDDDFCMRARKQGYRIGVALKSWIFHYVSTSSGRKTHENKNRDLFLSRWEEEALNWNRNHFEETFITLKSWSIQH